MTLRIFEYVLFSYFIIISNKIKIVSIDSNIIKNYFYGENFLNVILC